MLNIKGTKLLGKFLSGILAAMIMVCGVTTTAFASGTTSTGSEPTIDGIVISHDEEWVTPLEHVETTIYDLDDGFTATVTTTNEYSKTRAAGTRTATQEVEIKEGSVLAGTAKVTATFSYDGKLTCKVTSATHSKSTKSGYTEESWKTSKADYQDHMLAHATSTLKVKNNASGTTKSASAMVTCTPNG